MPEDRPAQDPLVTAVRGTEDVAAACRAGEGLARALGLDERRTEEVRLVVRELGQNLVRHAGGGEIRVATVQEDERVGLEVLATDRGPGIVDVERALEDGFSTAGSLGYGLGSVDRLCDEIEIVSPTEAGRGTRVRCTKWVAARYRAAPGSPLAIGVATRPRPGMAQNGDAFVIQTWDTLALVGVIDGLGHGQFAHRASRAARRAVEEHPDRPLDELFRRTARACRATRGAVMALARIDWSAGRLWFASVGDIEAHLRSAGGSRGFVVRRGILGSRAPAPVMTEHPFGPGNVLVLHSDGLSARWSFGDFPGLWERPAEEAARALMRAKSRDDDDATVMVVRHGGTP